jgi:hypothetical protein
MKRIMYVENKGDGLEGPGRIGWVELSKSKRAYLYQGRRLQKTKSVYKYNCYDAKTREKYWVSGPKKNGSDRLYGGIVEIDEDAREEYWTKVRNKPNQKHLTKYRST